MSCLNFPSFGDKPILGKKSWILNHMDNYAKSFSVVCYSCNAGLASYWCYGVLQGLRIVLSNSPYYSQTDNKANEPRLLGVDASHIFKDFYKNADLLCFLLHFVYTLVPGTVLFVNDRLSNGFLKSVIRCKSNPLFCNWICFKVDDLFWYP